MDTIRSTKSKDLEFNLTSRLFSCLKKQKVENVMNTNENKTLNRFWFRPKLRKNVQNTHIKKMGISLISKLKSALLINSLLILYNIQ